MKNVEFFLVTEERDALLLFVEFFLLSKVVGATSNERLGLQREMWLCVSYSSC